MPIVSLDEAKSQLNILDDEDNLLITTFIDAAIGMVEHYLQREIYESQVDVPESATNFLVFSDLKPTKKSVLKAAIMLSLSTLYTYRESELDINLSENPAFKACLKGFNCVVVG